MNQYFPCFVGNGIVVQSFREPRILSQAEAGIAETLYKFWHPNASPVELVSADTKDVRKSMNGIEGEIICTLHVMLRTGFAINE